MSPFPLPPVDDVAEIVRFVRKHGSACYTLDTIAGYPEWEQGIRRAAAGSDVRVQLVSADGFVVVFDPEHVLSAQAKDELLAAAGEVADEIAGGPAARSHLRLVHDDE